LRDEDLLALAAEVPVVFVAEATGLESFFTPVCIEKGDEATGKSLFDPPGVRTLAALGVLADLDVLSVAFTGGFRFMPLSILSSSFLSAFSSSSCFYNIIFSAACCMITSTSSSSI
jgi:hypothetical protein